MANISKQFMRMASACLLSSTFAVFAQNANAAGDASGLALKRDPAGDRLSVSEGVLTLPQCIDNTGTRVRFQLIRQINPMQPGGWVAFSTYTPVSGPVIQLGRDAWEQPLKTLQFAAAHECAHHSLGHVRQAFDEHVRNLPAAETPHQREFAADCEAARSLAASVGFTSTDLAEAFAVFPLNEHSTTHPPTSERLQRAIACLQP